MTPVARELSCNRGILEPLQTATSLQGQVDELKLVMEKNADFPVTLIGFSWGAWLSFIFAARHPEFVRKLILVGSGPFEEKYAEKIQETRLSRLNEKEKLEVTSLMETLENPATKNKNSTFEKLGKLISKADAFEPLDYPDEIIEYRFDIFQNVWQEASQLRESGNLLEHGKNIDCPVVAIHGDFDPHPAKGVEISLAAVVKNFSFILLEKCGHKPWIEKQARDSFYKILEKEL
jgi:pimeloyl-ACP methyl ester carboxylesterase